MFGSCFGQAHSSEMIRFTAFATGCPFAGHGPVLCGHVNPHFRHFVVDCLDSVLLEV